MASKQRPRRPVCMYYLYYKVATPRQLLNEQHVLGLTRGSCIVSWRPFRRIAGVVFWLALCLLFLSFLQLLLLLLFAYFIVLALVEWKLKIAVSFLQSLSVAASQRLRGLSRFSLGFVFLI